MHDSNANRGGRFLFVCPQWIREMRSLTLNNAESKQVTVLQPEEVTHLDQQLLAQSFHLRRTREVTVSVFLQDHLLATTYVTYFSLLKKFSGVFAQLM